MAWSRPAWVIVFIAATAVAPAAQEPHPPPAGPTLRAGVDQVVVDVVVTDAAGVPVKGLSAADFELFEDGRPQSIATFSEVNLPFTRRAEGSAPPQAASVASNAGAAEGRVYVLLLDDSFVMAARTPGVQQVAREFVDRYVQPGDLVAVVTTSGASGGTQPFTDDMGLVERAIDRFVGKKSRSAAIDKLEAYYREREMDPGRTRRADRNAPTFNRDGAVLGVNAIDEELLDRGRAALRTIQGVVQSLAGVGGRRKTLLYVSEGIDIPIKAGDPSDMTRELDGVFAAAARANVAVHALNPRGLHGMGDEIMDIRALPTAVAGEAPGGDLAALERERRAGNDMLRSLADGTGGRAAVDTNQLASALEQAVADSSHYYLLGYPRPSPKHDGRFHPIQVRVRRPELTVHARKGYAAPDAREAKVDLPKGLPPELDQLLKRPLPSSGLPVAAYAVALPVTKDNVAVTIEIGSNALGFVPKGDKVFNAVDVAILPVDGLGKTHGLAQGHPQLTIPQATADAVAAHGLRLSHRLTLPPGDYQLRIAVREANGGASGSVLCDLNVPDLAKPGLLMTPLLTSSSGATAIPSAYNDEVLMRALGGPATTMRSFTDEDTLSAYAELVDAGAKESRDVDILTIVRDARGRDVVKSPQPKANQRAAPGQSFAYAVDLPLKALAPGRYTLRVEARASGLAEPLARELAFDVRSASP